VTVVPATATAEEVLAQAGRRLPVQRPGDPAATGEYAVPVIQGCWKAASRSSASASATSCSASRSARDLQDAPGPSRREPSGQAADHGAVEITSMNHGFAVNATLPANARETHVSLFDGSLPGCELTDKPAFSVQYHPEASPGPQDSHYLFEQFVSQLR
jgi:carbamoyl-phosphate synthase small subunit